MFIASAGLQDGKTLLILGLSRTNRDRLEAGQPIDISREVHGLSIPANLKIMIFAGETEAAMEETLRELIGPTTVKGQKKPI
jgi:hypothetical protein